LVVTNDTGPMHIAAALEKPVVALFGPTDPSGTGPYGQKDNVIQLTQPPCIPCMKGECNYERKLACLRDITPPMMLERVKQSLAAGKSA
jgi:ADP-heptose:LPS heptosyltransferase